MLAVEARGAKWKQEERAALKHLNMRVPPKTDHVRGLKEGLLSEEIGNQMRRSHESFKDKMKDDILRM